MYGSVVVPAQVEVELGGPHSLTRLMNDNAIELEQNNTIFALPTLTLTV